VALRHISVVFLREEVAIWFQANQGSAAMAYCPTSSPVYHHLLYSYMWRDPSNVVKVASSSVRQMQQHCHPVGSHSTFYSLLLQRCRTQPAFHSHWLRAERWRCINIDFL